MHLATVMPPISRYIYTHICSPPLPAPVFTVRWSVDFYCVWFPWPVTHMEHTSTIPTFLGRSPHLKNWRHMSFLCVRTWELCQSASQICILAIVLGLFLGSPPQTHAHSHSAFSRTRTTAYLRSSESWEVAPNSFGDERGTRFFKYGFFTQ